MYRFAIVISIAVASLGAAPATQPSMDDQCQALLRKWQGRFEAEGLVWTISSPFVIAGDGGRARVEQYRDHTILAAADAMHRKFFDAQPTRPILILLFETEGPYRKLAKKWLGDDDVSHFGYFRSDNVMVMNIGTGGGTLIHELTHALIRPDFPGVPDWFNEGLGSLFEQCRFEAGDIRGLANWRLEGLQKTIHRDKLRPLRDLIEDADFYGEEHVGINYAQARYLLMYLQEHGKLPEFYKRLKAAHESDANGLATLEATIAPQSLVDFDKQWRQWVLRLHFP
jgi:hypothetical protein